MATNTVHNMHHNNRTVAEVLADFKEELKEFTSTRIQMLRAEMTEKTQAWKTAAPTLVIGAALLWISLLLFTGMLVSAIAWAFAGRPYAALVAFAIVFVVYALAGGIAVMYGIRTLKASGVAPARTLKVLKQDQIWLQTEAKTQV